MKNSKWIKIGLISLVFIVIGACNMPFNVGAKTTPSGDQQTNPADEQPEIDILPEIIEEVDPYPVGLQEGLGSFDSYQIAIYVNYYDSTGAKTEVTDFVERSLVDRNSRTVMTVTSFDPENDEEESTSTQETINVGNVTCQGSGEEWDYDEMTSQEKELMDVFENMVDFLPLINNPVYIGEESINGIDCNHFSFQVAGIGDTSGSIATYNQGDYWLAKDGNYIVKYHLELEVQSAAEGSSDAQISNLIADIDLQNVNVPLSFSLPSACVPELE